MVGLVLFRSRLALTLNSDWSGHSMLSLTEYESSIRRQVRLTLMQCSLKVSRVNQLSGLLLQAMLMVSVTNGTLYTVP